MQSGNLIISTGVRSTRLILTAYACVTLDARYNWDRSGGGGEHGDLGEGKEEGKGEMGKVVLFNLYCTGYQNKSLQMIGGKSDLEDCWLCIRILDWWNLHSIPLDGIATLQIGLYL